MDETLKKLQAIRGELQTLMAEAQKEIDSFEPEEGNEDSESPWQEFRDYLEAADGSLNDAEANIPADV